MMKSSSNSRLVYTHQYVSHKIRRVRWQNSSSSSSSSSENGSIYGGGSNNLPERFATAGWDEAGGLGKNEVTIWQIVAEDLKIGGGDRGRNLTTTGDMDEDDGMFENEFDDDDIHSLTKSAEPDWKFVRSASMTLDSDVYELQFINDDQLLFATGNGELVLVKWSRADRSIRPIHTFDRMKSTNEACIGFSMFGNEIVALSSRGSLIRIAFDAAREQLIGKQPTNNGGIDGASRQYGPLTCLEHIGAAEIASGNVAGKLQLWDIRQRPEPRHHQLASGVRGGGAITAIRAHPSQRHILAAGYQSGALSFWDLRNTSLAITSVLHNVHDGPIWDLRFHPIYPTHLYSAGNDGQIYDWNAGNVRLVGENLGITPWSLSTDQLDGQLGRDCFIPENTMPVNSLDICGDAILAGVDDESVWMVKNLTLP